MPERTRVLELLSEVLVAALEQPHPTPELRQALNAYLRATEHPLRHVVRFDEFVAD